MSSSRPTNDIRLGTPGPSTLSDGTGQLRKEVQDGLADWQGSGEASIRTLVVDTLNKTNTTSHLASVPLTHMFITLISHLGFPELLSFFTTLIDGLDEDDSSRREIIAETLADAVEVLSQDAQDKVKEKSSWEPSEDGPAGDKGILLARNLVTSSRIPQNIPNLLHSTEILQKLNLVPTYYTREGLRYYDTATLQSAHAKRATTLSIKQSKYNLLRECSEGFSALIVLITSDESLAVDSLSETDEERRGRAKRVWDKVTSLIGYFNLSPPRVLDLILEVAGAQAAYHWRFFLDLLRCSSWGSTAYERTSRKGKAKSSGDWIQDELDSIRGAMAGEGDRTLAMVLGVKFSFSQKPDGEETSTGLIFMAALLLKYGFIRLCDLLPFLSPNDEQMSKIHETWKSTMQGTSVNKLASAGALVDDTVPTTANGVPSTTTTADAGKEEATSSHAVPEQRVMLLQALLSIGDLPHALYFLGRYPWLAQTHTGIADLVMLIVAHALEPLYRSNIVPPLQPEEDEFDWEAAAPESTKVEKAVAVTLLNPPPPSTPVKTFEFCYPDWTADLEEWSSVEELFTKGLRWLSLVRGLAARDTPTIVKICRMGAAHFAALQKEKELSVGLLKGPKTSERLNQIQPTADEMREWTQMIRISLLPALSVSNGVSTFDAELWSIVKHFPYADRFALYGEWKESTCNASGDNPCLAACQAAASALNQTKDVLKRVVAPDSSTGSNTIVDRGPARTLARISHSNPHKLWERAVFQVKTYSNIGQFIVDAGRYMGQLSTDVATFVLLDELSSNKLKRVDQHGKTAEPLENIATFLGDFNRRYNTMELEPVLQFVHNRLLASQSVDLIIVDKLVSIMSGVSPIENNAISDDQLRALSSGAHLNHEAFHATTIAVPRPIDPTDPNAKSKQAPVDKNKSTKKSLPRLVDSLRDPVFGIPIWVSLAQTWQDALQAAGPQATKTTAERLDSIYEAFIQYGDLLSVQLKPDEHIALTPDLATLVVDGALEFHLAFRILRPKLNALYSQEMDERKKAKIAALQLKLKTEKEGGVPSPSRISTPVLSPSPSPSMPSTPLPVEDSDIAMDGSAVSPEVGSSVSAPKSGTVKVKFPLSLRQVMEQASTLLPAEVNGVMKAPFFVTFWHMTLADIDHSIEAYDKAVASITALDRDLATWRNKELVLGRVQNKAAIPAEFTAERTRLQARRKQLEKEKDEHRVQQSKTRERLERESKAWFGQFILDQNLPNKLAEQLVQHCFFPRAILTPADALYVAKFIRMAHDFGAVGFSTLFVYQQLFSRGMAACIDSRTTTEARNFGRCLNAMLSDLHSWHKDEKEYQKSAIGQSDNGHLPGMECRLKPDSPRTPMTWNQFRNFYAKVHNCLYDALTSCLMKSDFMHVQNAITVGLQIAKHFPVMKHHGEGIQQAVQAVADGTKGPGTPDVKLQALGYLRQIIVSRPKAGPGPKDVKWEWPSDFHPSGKKLSEQIEQDKKKAAAAAKAAPTAPRSNATAAKPASATPGRNGAASSRATSQSDPQALRAKLVEARANRDKAPARDEVKPDTGDVKPSEAAASPARHGFNVPPAGPRATRSAAVASPAHGGDRASPSQADNINGAAANMAPPTGSDDAARAAERLRRFASVSQPPSGPSGDRSRHATPVPPSADVKADGGSQDGKLSDATSSSRPRTPQRPETPPTRTRARSRSVDSRVSERSRRDRRDRDDRDRREDRDRRDHRRDQPRGPGALDDSSRSHTPSERKASNDDTVERKKQDDLLRAREDKLATDDRDARRSSRGARGHETDKEREERRAKERREKKDETGQKRKRDDEPVRRPEDPRDRDRHRDRRDERRKHDGRDDRRDDRRDRRDDRDDRDRDRRHRDRERDSRDIRDNRDPRDLPRDARDIRDPRDARDPRDNRDSREPPRDARGPRNESRNNEAGADRDRPPHDARNENGRAPLRRPSPEKRVELLPSRPPAPADAPARSDDPTQARSAPRGLPDRPAPSPAGERIIEAPRPTRSGDPARGVTNGNGIQIARHGLPNRPAPADASRPSRPTTPPRPSGGGDLLSRMGGAGGGTASNRPEPTRQDSTPRALDSQPRQDNSRPAERDVTPQAREDRATPDPRKRPHEEEPGSGREASPSVDKKRRVLNRANAKRDDSRGGGAPGRMLEDAMKRANGK